MFLGVLYACSTLFDVNEGLLHFESMSKAFGTAPSMDHYVGVVKMLACSGHLDEAFEFIEDMPVEPSIDVWETLMNLCRIHGNLEIGDLCANIVALLDPSQLNVESKAGFVPVNPSDMQNKSGYIPELRYAMHDVDDESKAEILLAHSEILACVSGILSSPARSQVRILMNVGMCMDCHNALKIISKIVGRRISARASKRFHQIEEGFPFTLSTADPFHLKLSQRQTIGVLCELSFHKTHHFRNPYNESEEVPSIFLEIVVVISGRKFLGTMEGVTPVGSQCQTADMFYVALHMFPPFYPILWMCRDPHQAWIYRAALPGGGLWMMMGPGGDLSRKEWAYCHQHQARRF
ncbi:hypothetical protein C5167_011536 [Papaver somniferum]|uniref:DYW domain-containing protein n=1 Tax=Papaver somniferum TaxID=3469 RepID=A0A4Y7K7D2_PAPSO|nr:hypothetical protein C5167_011536 [Papaver somniferum]